MTGRCTAVLDVNSGTKCDLLTLSASGCSTTSSVTTAANVISDTPIGAPGSPDIGLIVGAAVGGVAALAIVVTAIVCLAKRRSNNTAKTDHDHAANADAGTGDLSRHSQAAWPLAMALVQACTVTFA